MAKKKSGWKYLTVPEFEKIHQMQELGLTNTQIGKLLDRPYGTVSSVLKYPSLEEYREANRRAKKEQRKTAVPKDTAVDNQVNNSIHNTMKLIAQRLDHVENQLQELIDTNHALAAAEDAPKKKGLIW